MQWVEIPDYNKMELNVRKEEILRYLKKCEVWGAVAGLLRDVFTGKYVKLEFLAYRDDKYKWTSELTYHFEKYDCVLPPDFLRHILGKLRAKN